MVWKNCDYCTPSSLFCIKIDRLVYLRYYQIGYKHYAPRWSQASGRFYWTHKISESKLGYTLEWIVEALMRNVINTQNACKKGALFIYRNHERYMFLSEHRHSSFNTPNVCFYWAEDQRFGLHHVSQCFQYKYLEETLEVVFIEQLHVAQ